MKKYLLFILLLPPLSWPMEPPLARSSLEIYKGETPVGSVIESRTPVRMRSSLEIYGEEEIPEISIFIGERPTTPRLVNRSSHGVLERNEGFYIKKRHSKKKAVLNALKSIGSVAAKIACVALRAAS